MSKYSDHALIQDSGKVASEQDLLKCIFMFVQTGFQTEEQSISSIVFANIFPIDAK